MVKSTYNFVPAPTEDKVYKPEWASLISHDIPFEDGESGEVEVEISAETPIYIRNGRTTQAQDDDFSNLILNGEKKYFIPATTLKGMTRNVLEILSFSRLNKDLVNNNKYSFRDVSRNSEYLREFKKLKISAGWLSLKDGKWVILKSSFAFINHEELINNGFELFKDFTKRVDNDQKTAQYKYEKAGSLSRKRNFKITTNNLLNRSNANFDDQGNEGTLIFTGQSSIRNNERKSGKFHEFVFYNKSIQELIISEKVRKEFEFIYCNDDDNEISADWKYWREKMKKGEDVPVFYCSNIDPKDNKENVIHLGLTYMYKLPYKHSTHEMLPLANYTNSNYDLAQAIFGYTNKDSLKGRVFFGHAFADPTSVKVLPEVNCILGGPKASYFPFYLEQYKSENHQVKTYNTYNDKTSLKGFKRYPVRNEVFLPSSPEKLNENVITKFQPLDKGCTFKFKIRFHNLRTIEIGALLSALTFHNHNDCYHNLGLAKSLGYGKLKLNITSLKYLNHDLNSYLFSFQEEMTSKVGDWNKSRQLKELIAMSSNTNESFLQYPSLEEYQKYKGADYEFAKLDDHSEITNQNIKFKLVRLKSLVQPVFNFTGVTFTDLTNQMNPFLEEHEVLNDDNKLIIHDLIAEMYRNDKESQKKLKKKVKFWEEIIPDWIGSELTQNLIKQLNIDLSNFNNQ